MLYAGLQILFSDAPKTTKHPLLMMGKKQLLQKQDLIMQEFIDLCPDLLFKKEKKPFFRVRNVSQTTIEKQL